MTSTELEARAALMRAADAGDATMGRLVAFCGAEAAVEAICTQTLPPEFITQEVQAEGTPDHPSPEHVRHTTGRQHGSRTPTGHLLPEAGTQPIPYDAGSASLEPPPTPSNNQPPLPPPLGTRHPTNPDHPHGTNNSLHQPSAHLTWGQGADTTREPGAKTDRPYSTATNAQNPSSEIITQDLVPFAPRDIAALISHDTPALTRQRISALTRRRVTHLTQRLQTWHARLAASNPTADLIEGERSGARLIIPGTPEWPTQLDQLGPARPLGLWLHGSADLRFSCLRSVAIVGARAATPYGVHVAAEFAVGLSDSGWTVVSGGAFGIDGAAHRGALAADSPTVVVLACGVDISYPAGHHELFAAARDQGVVVSECPPGVHPTRARFLIRNRLIAALSRGTVVVEAALRSGALNTAGHALSLQRHLAAVPGPITSATSAGCHRLLRERKAVCVTSPDEMIELVGVIGDDLAPQTRGPAVPRDALNETTRSVLDAVPSRGGAGPASIAVTAGVSLDAALSALGGLAAAGYVERVEKGWRTRRTAPTAYQKAHDTAPSRPSPSDATDPDDLPPPFDDSAHFTDIPPPCPDESSQAM
ncbi:DNA-processing protein DprA [Nonomuraea rhizosphaerae]|uniref:DNA-processing protein DprA n=1 Tax=Nonomuraea rhizosphaerae TaxID=2665663 RepID=UPI0027E248F8|nr:DNA-processing protein DprA [Nonomuraea rhizosphaerae]